MRKRIIPVAAIAAALAVPAAASASVALDSTGHGFVGKGDVQTVLGYNNGQMQGAAGTLAFGLSQPVKQDVTQTATQVGVQSGTQAMSQDVSCTINGQRQTFHRDGERSGSRIGSREGSREGSRTGAKTGTISSSVAYDQRQRNQVTGFNLTGVKGDPTTDLGPLVWDDEAYKFGTYSFTDGFAFGATTWGDWDAAPGENPADCLNPGNNGFVVNDLSNVTTAGGITEDATEDGATTEHLATYGGVENNGPASLLVNSKLLATLS